MTAMTTCPPTSTNTVTRLRAALRRCSQARRTKETLRALPAATLLRLNRDFLALAHAHQRPPLAGNDRAAWRTWLLLGGRGAGKTRSGAEFVRALVHGRAPWADTRHGAIALIGEPRMTCAR